MDCCSKEMDPKQSLDTLMLIGVGGDTFDCKSTTGYLFQICGMDITWQSKKQSYVALSTAKEEYVALSGAAQEAVWL